MIPKNEKSRLENVLCSSFLCSFKFSLMKVCFFSAYAGYNFPFYFSPFPLNMFDLQLPFACFPSLSLIFPVVFTSKLFMCHESDLFVFLFLI